MQKAYESVFFFWNNDILMQQTWTYTFTLKLISNECVEWDIKDLDIESFLHS